MDRKQALDQLRVMQAWHEDFGNGPCPDYDAICYAIGVVEEAPEGLDNLIKALEQEHKKLLEMQKAQPEIIRCKDCKYRMPYDWMFSETWQSQNIDDYPEDEIGCLYCDMAMKADDYCSRAERIKGDTE
jgi:predicted nucleic-acid-binding Zn-ribbon protein